MKDSDLSRETRIDVAWSVAIAIVVFVLCLALGGFSFFAPWLIVTPMAMFAAGLIRGQTPGLVIVKATALSTFLLMLLILATLRSPLTLLAGIPIIVAPAVAGVATRRRWMMPRQHHLA
jgi:hypothetical protein